MSTVWGSVETEDQEMVFVFEESQSSNLVGEVRVIARERDAMLARTRVWVNEGIFVVRVCFGWVLNIIEADWNVLREKTKRMSRL